MPPNIGDDPEWAKEGSIVDLYNINPEGPQRESPTKGSIVSHPARPKFCKVFPFLLGDRLNSGEAALKGVVSCFYFDYNSLTVINCDKVGLKGRRAPVALEGNDPAA